MPTARQTVRRLTELRSDRKQLEPVLAPAGVSVASRLLEAGFDKQDLLDLLAPDDPPFGYVLRAVRNVRHPWFNRRWNDGRDSHGNFRTDIRNATVYKKQPKDFFPGTVEVVPLYGDPKIMGELAVIPPFTSGVNESARGLLEAGFDKQDLLDLLVPDLPKRVSVVRDHWRELPSGNYYHTIAIHVDGEKITTLGPTYSAGNLYEYDALTWLVANGYLPKPQSETITPWGYYEELGIKYMATSLPRGVLESISFDKRDLLDLLSAPQKIEVYGRRWHQRSYGGVYHVADVHVDGKKIATVGPAYGYGDGYEQTALDWLIANGYLPPQPEGVPPWAHLSDLGIEYRRNARDVKRERDLFLS